MARKDGTIAALAILAAECLFYDTISDPGYTLGMWTQDARVLWRVNNLPTIGLLILSPMWILMARSSRLQVIGFLLPSSLVLLIVELLNGSAHPDHTLTRWLARGLGATEFLLILALAIALYSSHGSRMAPKGEELVPIQALHE